MKYIAKQYALALFESLEKKAEAEQTEIIKRFAEVLLKNNDRGLLPKIYQQLSRIRREKTGRHDITLVTAEKAPQKLIEEISEKFGRQVDIEEIVDPEMGGGAKILINNEYLIDGTFKGRVERLTQQILAGNIS